MALFLAESVAPVETVTLEEAHLGLLEAVESLAELNEALLRADFVIHEQTRMLSEAEQESAKTGFLAKATAAVKKAAATVKAKVIALWNALVARLKGLWAKISGKDKALSVPKGLLDKLDGLVKGLETIAAALVKDHADVAALDADVQPATKAFDTALDAAIADAKAATARESVKPASLNKVNAFATRFAALSNSAARSIDKQVAGANGDQAKIAVAKKVAGYHTSLAARASKVTALVFKAVGTGAEAAE